jgi:hypothetical protein
MKVLRQAFLYLHFRFEFFLAQEYWRKCALKMLVKLTTRHIFRTFSRKKYEDTSDSYIMIKYNGLRYNL